MAFSPSSCSISSIRDCLNDAIRGRRESVDVEDHTVAVKFDDGAMSGEGKVELSSSSFDESPLF